MPERLVIGTRGSALALVQTHAVRDSLRQIYPDLALEVKVIRTEGDRSQAANTPLSSFSEKGIFATELESALFAGDIDIAVHSMKDLASVLPVGLVIAAVPERQDPRDALVGKRLQDLVAGQTIGTGSVRRSAILQNLRPDLIIANIRGNVDTRISKLRDGLYDAICIAVAGLTRLGRAAEITEIMDPMTFVPDPGQGAIAIESRRGDDGVNRLLQPLNHYESVVTTRAERSFLQAFGGGCQTPVGAWAVLQGDELILRALAATKESPPLVVVVNGSPDDADDLGRQAARLLG